MRVKTVAAAGILATAGFVVSVAPASASLDQCNYGHMCMWGNNDYKWLLKERIAGLTGIVDLTGEINDEMDSWANVSSEYAGCMFEHHNGGGDKQFMARVSKDSNVAPWNSDEVSSWRTINGCPP